MEDRSTNENGTLSPKLTINAHSTIHGGQTNIFNGQPSEPIKSTKSNPCISPTNLSPVSTYVDRSILSKEISSKMQKSCGNKSLAHALAVTGLGGTGKTQLVLHYVEKYRGRYDTVLWIDAHDEVSVLSSFERCCNALSIRFEQPTSPARLQDAASVQSLHQWLALRSKEQKWLVIFDNADELADVSFVIPRNKAAGSVIITSQDGNATRLLRAKTTAVDKMEIQEAKDLLAQSMDLESFETHSEVSSLLEELSNRLDRIALAVDLAGARVRDDMESRYEMLDIDVNEAAVNAIKQYLLDLDNHKRSILSDSEYNDISQYKKTIWSVWETVLVSLKGSELKDAARGAFPLQLLKLAAVLGPIIIHREAFRSASQSLRKVSAQILGGLPQWFEQLLHLSEDRTWDMFAYNESFKRLIRFHLVQPVSEEVSNIGLSRGIGGPVTVSWPGFSMHGLVRWRIKEDVAKEKTTETECELCRVVLAAACCRTNNETDEGLDFRQVLRNYLPQEGNVWQLQNLTRKGTADLFSSIGTTFLSVRDFGLAKHFLLFAYLLRHKIFGHFAPATIKVGLDLYAYGEQTREYKYKAVIEEFRKWCDSKAHRVTDDSTASTIQEFKADFAARMSSPDLIWPLIVSWTMQYTHFCHPSTDARAEPGLREATSESVWRQAQKMIANQARELELAVERLGKHHRAVTCLMSNIARIYSIFGEHEAEKRYLEYLLTCVHQSFGVKHCETLQVLERYALCRSGLNDSAFAIPFMGCVVQMSRDVFGDDDPRTRLRESHVTKFEEQEVTLSLSAQEQEAKSYEDNTQYLQHLINQLSPDDIPLNTKHVKEMIESKDFSSKTFSALTRFMLRC